MVAIICEFNPFHNGHQYIIETAKRLTNEPVLAVMSGSRVLCPAFCAGRRAHRQGV